MTTYILKRLVSMVPVLFIVSIVIFSLIHLTPGDPVTTMLGEEATPEARDALRRQLGLDRPLPLQYAAWLGRVVTGDLGRSIRTNQPVAEAIGERLPITIELAVLATLIATSVAIPLGVISAVKRDTRLDFASRVGGLIGLSLPSFWVATLALLFTSKAFGWVPKTRFISPFDDLAGNLQQMFLPAFAIAIQLMAIEMRMTRTTMLEVLNQDYIRTARAKGLREGRMVRAHALKNALMPVVTIVGLQIGGLLGGAIITESIFVLPGIGRLLVDSIFQRDFPLVQGVVLFVSLAFLFSNFAVDLMYAYLDPRIRYG